MTDEQKEKITALRHEGSGYTAIANSLGISKDTLYDTDALETERTELQEELNMVAEMVQQCVSENAHKALDQTEYQKRYDGLVGRFDRTKERLDVVSHAIVEKQAQREKVEMFLAELEKQNGLCTEFDESLWISLVDYVTVFNKEDVRFNFKDGTEIKA